MEGYFRGLCYNFRMYYIVGLGNPGLEYATTRHNIGRLAVDVIADHLDIEENFKTDKVFEADKAKGEWHDEAVTLLKPNTFMNRSGKSVAPIVSGLAKEAGIKKAAKVIVIHDDIDLPLGKIRIIFNRGSGGHKGVESIKKALKTEGFVRIKIGIMPTTPTGKPKKPKGEQKILDFILGEFQKGEMVILKKSLHDVRDAVALIVQDERVKAMNEFN